MKSIYEKFYHRSKDLLNRMDYLVFFDENLVRKVKTSETVQATEWRESVCWLPLLNVRKWYELFIQVLFLVKV